MADRSGPAEAGPRSRRRLLVMDALLLVALVGTEALLSATLPEDLRGRSWPALLGWSLVAAAPVLVRRVAVWPAVGATVATLLLPLLLAHTPISQALTFVVVTYTTAARLRLRPAVGAALLLWLPVYAANLTTPQVSDPVEIPIGYALLINLLLALVCFFVGRTVHTRRAYTVALEERAETAEQNQRALAEQAVADERRRIARELHDVVAHHLSVMGVLATGARRVLRRDPDAADEALATIEYTSRATLREMRRLLRVLRSDAEVTDELAPQPGLAGITALVAQVDEAGLPVTLEVRGTPAALDPGLALTVYRVVQEALTNALKHAGHTTAAVLLIFESRCLTVEVTDSGRGPAPGPVALGHGLVGMRERVALYGGTLRAGPRAGGGFRVYARIPLDHAGTAVQEQVG